MAQSDDGRAERKAPAPKVVIVPSSAVSVHCSALEEEDSEGDTVGSAEGCMEGTLDGWSDAAYDGAKEGRPVVAAGGCSVGLTVGVDADIRILMGINSSSDLAIAP